MAAQFHPLGRHVEDVHPVDGELVDRRLERRHEFGEILLVDLTDIHPVAVVRDRLRIEEDRVRYLDRIGTVRPQGEVCIIKGIKVGDRIAGAELDPLDLLKIDKINLLLGGGDAAVLKAVERLAQGVAELPVEHGRHGGAVHRIIAGLRRIIYNFASVYQHHKLIGIDVHHRAV